MTLLPNGWRIAPAGRHLDAGDLPLAMALHPDGRHLVITNNGWSKPSLRVVDLERRQVIQRLALDHAWLGLVWHPDGRRLFSSGAADNSIREVEWRDSKLAARPHLLLAPPQKSGRMDDLENAGFVGGLALSPDARTLYAAQVYGKARRGRRRRDGAACSRAPPCRPRPTRRPCRPTARAVYVSVWGAARVAVLEPRTLAPARRDRGRRAPERDGALEGRTRLFVACANTNAVWVVDLASAQAVERIGVALSPKAPPGSTPNALALSPDGATLLVANADNNTVAVVDVTRPGREPLPGLHPHRLVPDRRRVRPRRASASSS